MDLLPRPARQPATRRWPLLATAGVVAVAFAIWWMRHPPVDSRPDTGHSTSAAVPRQAVLLVTVDGLRADRLGTGETPAIDRLAAAGTRFTRAYAAAPLTLPSHASLFTGGYPQRHGARADGLRMRAVRATLATRLREAGFVTAAFVSSATLAPRFGLDVGFDRYQAPAHGWRDAATTVDAARAWVAAQRATRAFLWVHLGVARGAAAPEPANTEAGPDVSGGEPGAREADRHVARLLDTVAAGQPGAVTVLAGSHGVAMGDHDEGRHGLFVYDSTLHVPLVMAGPGVPAGRGLDRPVGLVDVAPTLLGLLGLPPLEADGLDLSKALVGEQDVPDRDLYAESYAPLVCCGWAPTRSVRSGRWKFIEAPRPELYDLISDPLEQENVVARWPREVARVRERLDRFGTGSLTLAFGLQAELAAQAGLGDGPRPRVPGRDGPRADPKDRRAAWAQLAAIEAGVVEAGEAVRRVQRLVREDPGNGLAHQLLGEALAREGDCAGAERHLRAAIAAPVPSAAPYLALAACLDAAGHRAAAQAVVSAARKVDPGHPGVEMWLGRLACEQGRLEDAIDALGAAVRADPDLHDVRLSLARALARTGRLQAAREHVQVLLAHLRASDPRHADVQRLADTLR